MIACKRGHTIGGFRCDYKHPYSDGELELTRRMREGSPAYGLFNNMQVATDAERLEPNRSR